MTIWKSLMGMVFAVGLITPAALSAQDKPELWITTGSAKGTYYRFASEIAQGLPEGLQLNIAESSGSVQNLRRLLGYEGASENKFYQLALVQADVLEQLRSDASRNPTLRDIVDRIKVVMPLYGEEIHAFARIEDDFSDIRDAIDRAPQISAGNESSGTFLTARWLLEQMGYVEKTTDLMNTDGENGLPAIQEYAVDVLFHVAGAPSSLGLSISPDAGIGMVEIEAEELLARTNSPYRRARLTPADYPWLKRDVDTIAVTALLVAFDYPEDNPYCGMIETLTQSIVELLPQLQKDYGAHPKWKDVDLRTARNRQDLYACSQKVIFGQ